MFQNQFENIILKGSGNRRYMTVSVSIQFYPDLGTPLKGLHSANLFSENTGHELDQL